MGFSAPKGETIIAEAKGKSLSAVVQECVNNPSLEQRVLLFQQMVSSFQLIQCSEQSLEGLHAELKRAISCRPNHSAAFLSNTLRFADLEAALDARNEAPSAHSTKIVVLQSVVVLSWAIQPVLPGPHGHSRSL